LFYIRSCFIVDTTEDILAKYRRKPSASGDSTASETGTELKAPQLVGEVEDERLSMDPANIEASYAFIDAKRKLRMVLSTADLQHVPWAADTATRIVRDYPSFLCFIEDCASCRRAVGNVLMHNMFISSFLPSFLPLSTTAQGELWPPEQSASLLLYPSSILPILSVSFCEDHVHFLLV
jgi:hypothetical protein